jgi:hypothetical protein
LQNIHVHMPFIHTQHTHTTQSTCTKICTYRYTTQDTLTQRNRSTHHTASITHTSPTCRLSDVAHLLYSPSSSGTRSQCLVGGRYCDCAAVEGKAHHFPAPWRRFGVPSHHHSLRSTHRLRIHSGTTGQTHTVREEQWWPNHQGIVQPLFHYVCVCVCVCMYAGVVCTCVSYCVVLCTHVRERERVCACAYDTLLLYFGDPRWRNSSPAVREHTCCCSTRDDRPACSPLHLFRTNNHPLVGWRDRSHPR